MQTIAFAENLRQIVSSAQIAALKLHVDQIVGPTILQLSTFRERFVALAFAARTELNLLRADPDKAQIIDSLGFEAAFASGDFGLMITAVNSFETTKDLANNPRYVSIFLKAKASWEALIALDATVQRLLLGPRKNAILEGESFLEFEIIDTEGKGIGFDRFEAILAAIRVIHDSVARALEIEARLAIAHLDSGSNSVIGIKSNGKAIEAIRKLIIDVWDRIRYGKYQNFERKLEAVEEGVKLVELLQQKEKDGKLPPDLCAQLRHLAIKETLTLFGKGATLREIHRERSVDDRQMLLQHIDVKLLESGTNGTEQAARQPRPDSDQHS